MYVSIRFSHRIIYAYKVNGFKGLKAKEYEYINVYLKFLEINKNTHIYK